ncbi:MAG: alpha/beta fold hydrolase [Acidimicrobiales bacterium]
MATLEQIELSANGVRFAALACGPEQGPLALCLHGFPDSARTWRYLLPDLAALGYRAVAPWMRGYAPTQVPADASYGVGALAADACAIHDAVGAGADAVLIGHDWGAIAGYAAAGYAPERWSRLVTAAVPPLGAIGMKLFSYDQLKRSFYMFVFQNPLAEMAVAADDMAFIARLWEDWSPGYDGAEDVAGVKDALRDPANLAAALGYYRAMLGTTPPDPTYDAQAAAAGGIPPQPTLYLHGDQDGCMAVDLATDAEAFLSPGSKAEVVTGTGHFLHVEKPDEVNRMIGDWVTPA